MAEITASISGKEEMVMYQDVAEHGANLPNESDSNNNDDINFFESVPLHRNQAI